MNARSHSHHELQLPAAKDDDDADKSYPSDHVAVGRSAAAAADNKRLARRHFWLRGSHATCRLCCKTLKRTRGGSVSNLLSHLRHIHRDQLTSADVAKHAPADSALANEVVLSVAVALPREFENHQ